MNRDLSVLSLAKKAGMLAAGSEAVRDSLRGGRAKLVIVAGDAGDNIIRQLESRARGVTVLRLPYGKEELGAAIGYRALSVAAICDGGFAAAFIKKHSAPTG